MYGHDSMPDFFLEFETQEFLFVCFVFEKFLKFNFQHGIFIV